jgi:putative transcriptional regulator
VKKLHISNSVRELRFHAGEMTQQELAERVGVTRQTIVAIEKQSYSPSLELAFRIARAFDKRVEEVFRYQPDEEPSTIDETSNTGGNA